MIYWIFRSFQFLIIKRKYRTIALSIFTVLNTFSTHRFREIIYFIYFNFNFNSISIQFQ